MTFVALRMLTGDRAKYLGLIFAVAFASFLMSHQSTIFIGILNRTTSQIRDVVDSPVWVMDPKTQYFDEIQALNDNDLYRVRSVAGVQWAVRLFKGLARAKAPDGNFRTVILMGLDDASLAGAPRKMILGDIASLRRPDAVILDRAGYLFFFPNEPLTLGRTLEMNDRRVSIVGICDASPPFQTFPVLFTRYSQALNYVGRERNLLSFVLAGPVRGVGVEELTRRIHHATGLKALTGEEWAWATIAYYLRNTGIPVNFGITITIALVVGTVVAGQTFYIFTIENLKQFGALKAIGVGDWRLTGMTLLQALVVGAAGFALGIGGCAAFIESTKNQIHLRGFVLPWQILTGTGAVVLLIVVLASLMSIRRVWKLEPAEVIRG